MRFGICYLVFVIFPLCYNYQKDFLLNSYLKYLCGLLFTIVFVNLSFSQSPMFRGDLNHSGNFKLKALEIFREVRWTFRTDGPVRSSPAVTGGTIYVGSGDGNLYALDLTSGQKKWAFEAGSAVHSSPAVTNESLFFTTRNGALVALRTGDGTQLWKFQMGADLPNRWAYDYYQSSPAVVNGSVLVGGGDGNLYSLDAQTGKERWRFRAPARIRSSPAVEGEIVVVGDFAGHVYGIDLSGGRQLWKFDTEGASLYTQDFGFDRSAIVSSPSIHNGVVTVGGRDGFLYALSLKDGKERWRFNHEISWVLTSPAIGSGLVFAGSSDGRFVHAVDHQTGKEAWRFKTRGPVWGSPAICGDVLYFGDYDGYLYSVESKTGKELSRFKTGHLIHSSPIPVDGMVLIGSDDGYLYALGGTNRSASANSRQPRKAVFWEALAGNPWFTFGVGEWVRDYFKANGYEVIDSKGLNDFLKKQSDEGGASVIVFANNRFPSPLADDTTTGNPLRRYLDAGGKAVLLGNNPVAYIRDSSGQIQDIDFSRVGRVFGVNYSGRQTDAIGGWFSAHTTPAGARWGLKGWRMGMSSVEPREVTTVLARDENGRAAAWVKNFGGPEGTGLVQLWVRRNGPEDLSEVLSVAEYGLRGR